MGAGPVFGRARELGVIQDFVDRAAVDGASLLVSGEPGLGKTLLLEAAAEAARACGMVVLSASGAEFEAGLSYATLHQLLLPLSGGFDELDDAQRDALTVALGLADGAAAGRAAVSDAALALLRRAGLVRPVLLVVDDLQWADRSSAAVLGTVAGNLAGTRVGYLAASRPEADDRGLTVRPLSPDAAFALVTSRFPELAQPVLRRVLEEARGNPMALLELPAALSRGQRTARDPLPRALPLSRRLQSLFERRIEDLPAPTREVLLLTALESSADFRLLEPGAGPGSRLDDLVPAEQAGLVTIDHLAARMVFRHPVVRATVVQLSTEGERRQAHAELAELVADQPERRAWHLADATAGSDERVAALLEQAGYRMAARADAVGAVTALLRAADLSPRRADRARRLAEAAYIGADVTGDLRGVPQLIEAARAADPGLASSLPIAIAAAYLLLNGEGDVATAHRLLVATIRDRTRRYDARDDALAEALHNLFDVCYFGGRAELWEPFDAVLGRLARGVPPLLRLRTAIVADPARATRSDLELLDSFMANLGDETDPVRVLRIAIAGSALNRTGECRAVLWRVVRDGRDHAAAGVAIPAMLLLCVDDLITGRWDEGDQLISEGLRLCQDFGYELAAWPFRWCMAWLAAVRGQNGVVRAVTGRISRWAAPRGMHAVEFYCHHVRAVAALGQPDFEEAYQQATAISPAGILLPRVPHALGVIWEVTESAVRTGRHDQAVAHVEALRQTHLAESSPRLALLVLGSAALTAGEDEAAGMFERALGVPGGDGWPFDYARVQLAYGERLRRMRASTGSRRYLTAALATFERLGARPWAARARKELQATGGTRVREARLGTSSLTQREWQVAMLAASGLTNKQIAGRLVLSARTVGAHLRQVFAKLGVTTRAGLRTALGPGSLDPEHGNGSGRMDPPTAVTGP